MKQKPRYKVRGRISQCICACSGVPHLEPGSVGELVVAAKWAGTFLGNIFALAGPHDRDLDGMARFRAALSRFERIGRMRK